MFSFLPFRIELHSKVRGLLRSIMAGAPQGALAEKTGKETASGDIKLKLESLV